MNNWQLSRFVSAVWTALFFCLPSSVQAHNGAVAIAVPVEGIEIDGNLADWPEGMRRYPIVWENKGRSKGGEDFSGWFRIGFSAEENALYVAVEMRDESVLIDSSESNTPWDVQDGCELYFDILHQRRAKTISSGGIWGTAFRNLGENVKVAVTREKNHHRYEWRVDVQGYGDGEAHLSSGMILGLDIILVDKDEDGSFAWVSWGMGSRKESHNENTGDIVLAGDSRKTGRIAGQVKWEGGQMGRRVKIEVDSQGAPEQWLWAATDPSGKFAVDLPPGEYRVGSPIVLRDDEEINIELQAEEEKWIELILEQPQGKKIRAGKGEITPARPGRRDGLWQGYGISDGLPPGSINAITQDNQGYLWFGTGFLNKGRGVIRYDGANYVAYTTENGLADDRVYCIVEDRQGCLWFGTEGGVTCYDGESMVTFTTADGLVGDQIRSMLVDGEGNIWFGTGDSRWDGFGGTGLSRYDGVQFSTFTMEDGLRSNDIISMTQDEKGTIWVGTGNGLSFYDGERFSELTMEESAMGRAVYAIDADNQGGIWFGRTGGASHFDGRDITHLLLDAELANEPVRKVLVDARDRLWIYPEPAGLYRYDGAEWVHFSASEGVGGDQVSCLYEDRDGALWIGIFGGGISRYDEDRFATFTKAEGLLKDLIFSIEEGPDGSIWLGYGGGGGVSRYDGDDFTHYSLDNEVADHSVWSIGRDREGHMFFGVPWVGVYRYDGEELSYIPEGNGAWGFAEGREGELWVSAGNGGLVRHDGEIWERFSPEDGLPLRWTKGIVVDRQGWVWVGTDEGVTRYDGSEFVAFSEEDGIPPGGIWSVMEDSRGQIWCGAFNGGVVRSDGTEWHRFDRERALEVGVLSIIEDDRGHIWFGLWGGGIVRYDGLVTQTLRKGDGLAHNTVQKIIQAQNGDVWIATEGGATRYRSRTSLPRIRMVGITADRKYGGVERIAVSSSQDFVSFQYRGASMHTPPERMVYVYRLTGHDDEWQQTNLDEVEYRNLSVGEYTFEVKAVDLDLNYSEPLSVHLSVQPPYERIGMVGISGLALIGLVVASGYGIRRRRERDRVREEYIREQQDRLKAQEELARELEEELQVAHEMQIGLMPADSPHIPGFDIAGRCIPANPVGGDFFQYFPLADGRLAISLADVTGHAMEAAIPVVMFSGILENQMEAGYSLEELFPRLNRSLQRILDRRTFVCFEMGELDPAARIFRFANSGCPYPYHFKASTGEVAELQVDAYPLGVRADTAYSTLEVKLEEDDRVVLCSDGIIEAENAAGELFGFERTAEVIYRGCRENLSAAELLDRIIGEVKMFTGDVPQGDDQTMVVLAVG